MFQRCEAVKPHHQPALIYRPIKGLFSVIKPARSQKHTDRMGAVS